MQRPATSSSRDQHHHVIDIMQQQQSPPPRAADGGGGGGGGLRRYWSNRRTAGGGGGGGAQRRSGGVWWLRAPTREKKIIHSIPFVVVFCIFVLWWFSYPVNLDFKDGRLIGTRKMELELPHQLVNQTRVDLTILMKKSTTATAAAIPPTASFSLNFTLMNATSAQPPVPPD